MIDAVICESPLDPSTAWALAFIVVGVTASTAAIVIAVVKWALS